MSSSASSAIERGLNVLSDKAHDEGPNLSLMDLPHSVIRTATEFALSSGEVHYPEKLFDDMVATLSKETIREKVAEYFYGPDKTSTKSGRDGTFNPSEKYTELLAWRLLNGITSYLTAEQTKLSTDLPSGQALSEWKSDSYTDPTLCRNLAKDLRFNPKLKAKR